MSSQRFKKDIKNISDTIDVSQVIDNLRPVKFTYNETNNDAYGLIAEEVQQIVPELVPLDKDGLPYSVRYADIVPFLIAEIQSLKRRITQLETL